MLELEMPFDALNSKHVLFAVRHAAELYSERNAYSSKLTEIPGLGRKPYYLVLANPIKSHILNETTHSAFKI